MNDIYRTFYEIVGQHYPEDDITYATISGIIRKKWIQRKMQELGTGNLLDCGCNVGRISACWRRGVVFGIDISYAVLARGRKLFSSTHFMHGDLRDMAFIRDRSIDNAIACEVVEHLDTPQLFLEHLHRVLKIGARALITVPGYTREQVTYIPVGIMRSYGVTAGTDGDCYLHRAYTPADLVDLARRAHFTVLDSGGFETELRLWQKPLTMIEHLFYTLSARLCPASRLNMLFQRAMDRIKINAFMILDTFGLSFVLNKLIKQGRRSYVILTK
jgi:SAM-dependent methyltransferase